MADLLTGLPGEELVRVGLDDLMAGKETVAGALLAIARTRLRNAGLKIEGDRKESGDAELRLYRLLAKDDSVADPYSRYNSLLRELISFTQALERRAGKGERLNEC